MSRITAITEFGAVGDGHTLNTRAIQAAIDAAGAASGGTVLIPEGTFVSGALFMKPGVSLHLKERAVLRCAPDPLEFPRQRTRIEGRFEDHFNPGLINADGCDGLRIIGNGTLDGHGTAVWNAFWRGRTHDPGFRNLDLDRARLCVIENSEGILIDGITFKDSQYWNLHFYNCRDVVVKHTCFTVPETYWKAPSTDGIDVDSCTDMVIRDCMFSVSDDCICLKGTKGPDAAADTGSPPVQRIQVLDCEFRRGCGAVTCGSEATVVQDVTVSNCRVTGRMPLARFKFRLDTPQCYRNFSFRDIYMAAHAGELLQIRPWAQYNELKDQPPPESTLDKVQFSNIRGAVCSLGAISAHPQVHISNIAFNQVELSAHRARLELESEVSSLSLEDVSVNGKWFTDSELSSRCGAAPNASSGWRY